MLKFSHPEDEKKETGQTQEMCERAVEEDPWPLYGGPDHFKTQEMCKAVEQTSWVLKFVSDHLKTQGVCERAVEKSSYTLDYVLDHLKTKKMCEKATEKTHGYRGLSLIISKPKGCVKGPLKMNQKP